MDKLILWNLIKRKKGFYNPKFTPYLQFKRNKFLKKRFVQNDLQQNGGLKMTLPNYLP